MRAAIYCRVSTDNQEREGTSLQTQLEACLKYCESKGYDAAYRYSEAYSGLSLERPNLDELRELVRTEVIDVVVIYSLDRFTRDPGHGVIITQELEKHHVKLEAVSEDVDNTELGKLISYIRGFASKLEAEKIKERTMRGKKACAKAGRMTGGFAKAYGWNYITRTKEKGGHREINEVEASWARQMFNWLINEQLSTNAVTYRLRAMNAPTKSGKPWCRRSVLAILTNPAYAGKTYAFTTKNHTPYTRPQSEWIEIPNVTPAIISQEIFDAAQKQLRANRNKTVIETKHQYLLRGHIRCRQCGRSYVAIPAVSHRKNGDVYVQRFYRCIGKMRIHTPGERCTNKGWNADILEAMVWTELESYLNDRDFIKNRLANQRQDAERTGIYEAELVRIEHQLKVLDREQNQLLQKALRSGFQENQVEAENIRINKARETLKAQKADLGAQLKASQAAAINLPNFEKFIEDMQRDLPNFDYDGKRRALDYLGITVWLDGQNVDITGIIEPKKEGVGCASTVQYRPVSCEAPLYQRAIFL